MDFLFQKVDLSLQNSGPFICEGGSSEPTEPPWLRTCHDQSAKALSTNNFCPSGFAVQSSQPTNVYLWTVIFQNFLLSKFYTIWY